MKKVVSCIIALGFLGFVMFPSFAGAAPVEIDTLPYEYSPDSNLLETPADDVFLNEWSSLLIAGGNAAVYDDYMEQPIGLYGVGVPLASLGPASTYNVYFDAFFYSWDYWDGEKYDVFGAVITKGDQLWNDGVQQGDPWLWGGSDSQFKDELSLPYGLQLTVNVTPDDDYYLFAGLLTTMDTHYISWGRFSDIHVEAIEAVPEPLTLILLGFGLIGLAGLRRK